MSVIFNVGDRVYLLACQHGEPGRILRVEGDKVAVLWVSLGPTFISRHETEALVRAELRSQKSGSRFNAHPHLRRSREAARSYCGIARMRNLEPSFGL
jgi:hypothetical protein